MHYFPWTISSKYADDMEKYEDDIENYKDNLSAPYNIWIWSTIGLNTITVTFVILWIIHNGKIENLG